MNARHRLAILGRAARAVAAAVAVCCFAVVLVRPDRAAVPPGSVRPGALRAAKAAGASGYATYWGGSDDETSVTTGPVTDADGNVYLVGGTRSRDYPRVRPFQKKKRGPFAVAKFDPSGRPVFSTYVAGNVFALRVDAAGNCYVAGQTTDKKFGTRRAYQRRFGGTTDLFVAKLDPAGTVVYSTFLGGQGREEMLDFAVDASGAAYLFGTTDSPDLPVHAAFQSQYGNERDSGGLGDGLVAKFDASGAAVYVTYLGSNASEDLTGFAVGADGSVYVGGDTFGANFPLANAAQGAFGGSSDACLVHLDPQGAALFSTYYGGSGFETFSRLAVDAAGDLVALMKSTSGDVPVEHAAQPASGGQSDLFVVDLAPTGTVVFATYLGGSANEDTMQAPYGGSLLVDAAGDVLVVGGTMSDDFPLRAAFDPTRGSAPSTAIVTKFDPTGALVYSTFMSGTDGGSIYTARLDAAGDLYAFGAASAGFPTKNPAFDASASGGGLFVAKLGPAGAAVYATLVPGVSLPNMPRFAVDAAGAAYVLGRPANDEVPLVRAFQTHGSTTLTKLDASGHAVFSTLLGGSTPSNPTDAVLLVDAAGDSFVVGATGSGDLTTVSAMQPTFGGADDAYVTALDAAGAPVFSTYFGGSDIEYYVTGGLDGAGALRITGNTRSPDLGVRAAAQATLGGAADFFAAVIGPQ